MKPAPFILERPETIDEALALLDRHGDDAKVLAGGQSLVALLNLRMARPEVVVDINRLGDLAGSLVEEGVLRVGALTRTLKVVAHPRSRVAAKQLPEYMTDLTPAAEYERARQAGIEHMLARERGKGRPTKRDRREMGRLFGFE